MKKLLLTTSEFTNQAQEVKKKRANVGRVHSYKEGGEAIVLDAAMCAVIGAMGQKALNAGEDSVWISIFEEDKNNPQQTQSNYQQPAAAPAQPAYQQPAPVQQQPPMTQQPPVNPNGYAQGQDQQFQ